MTIEEIREKFSKISVWPWFSKVGRAQPERIDIYTGIPIDMNSEGPPVMRALTKGFHTQVCHFHSVAENWINHNENSKNDIDFILHTPQIVDSLLKRIESLEEALKNKG